MLRYVLALLLIAAPAHAWWGNDGQLRFPYMILEDDSQNDVVCVYHNGGALAEDADCDPTTVADAADRYCTPGNALCGGDLSGPGSGTFVNEITVWGDTNGTVLLGSNSSLVDGFLGLNSAGNADVGTRLLNNAVEQARFEFDPSLGEEHATPQLVINRASTNGSIGMTFGAGEEPQLRCNGSTNSEREGCRVYAPLQLFVGNSALTTCDAAENGGMMVHYNSPTNSDALVVCAN